MTIQDKLPNFRDDTGQLFLVRCYACEPVRGTENYAPAVASGECAWCGWTEIDCVACDHGRLPINDLCNHAGI